VPQVAVPREGHEDVGDEQEDDRRHGRAVGWCVRLMRGAQDTADAAHATGRGGSEQASRRPQVIFPAVNRRERGCFVRLATGEKLPDLAWE
jgi:hypothetical protein